jgi:hypothetical protein
MVGLVRVFGDMEGGRIYGGNSLFGFLSISRSPSFGAGISGSGGHAVILCGVFQGTVGGLGWLGCSAAVVACLAAGILCRH